MTTIEKVVANRQNALRSTGPRTPQGKELSRRNALKHGLLAKEVLLASESATDLADLDRRLRGALRPTDDLEGLLVDRVVSCAWRLRRALKTEAADLESARAAVLRKQEEDNLSDITEDEKIDEAQRLAVRELERTVVWLQNGGDPLKDFKANEADLLDDAYVTLADREFPEMPEDSTESWGRLVRRHLRTLGWTRERTRDALLEILQQEIRDLRAEIWRRTKRAKAAKHIALRVCLVPRGGSLGRLLRYETAIERSFFRALHELHRLQAARGGGVLPPPVALDVTGAEF